MVRNIAAGMLARNPMHNERRGGVLVTSRTTTPYRSEIIDLPAKAIPVRSSTSCALLSVKFTVRGAYLQQLHGISA
jgi:hypothetical protein